MVALVHQGLADKEVCRLRQLGIGAVGDGPQVFYGGIVVRALEIGHADEVEGRPLGSLTFGNIFAQHLYAFRLLAETHQ